MPNFDSAPSPMPTLKPIIHFPQVPGLKLLEYKIVASLFFSVT